ncbi:MAG: hypothetical protein ABI614_26675, partial [Planctomycetota bacterium]
AAEWHDHEQVADQVQLAAQELVHQAGSPERAKHAIDTGEKHRQDSSSEGSQPIPSTSSPATFERNDSFLKAIEDFETALETPTMSGEMIDWVTAAQHACEHLGGLLHNEVQRQHADLYSRISREDPELASRVEKLRAVDEQLSGVDFDNVKLSLEQLHDRTQSAEQDEAKVELRQADAIKLALAFVISARTQETTIATWYGEAFNRDSGDGD